MQSNDSKPALADLSETQREQAMVRFAVLRPHLEQGTPLPQAASQAGVAVRTAQRWLVRYRSGGLTGLARGTRSDAGRRKVSAELVDFIEGEFLRKPRPSVATIHRRVVKLAEQQQWRVPSYGSLYTIIARLDPAMVTLAHEGQAAFRDRFELVYRHRAARPNQIWQADHTQLDLLILDANGKVIRPWLTTVIDDHSRVIAGYLASLTAMLLCRSVRHDATIVVQQELNWPRENSCRRPAN
jgi:putative transposase